MTFENEVRPGATDTPQEFSLTEVTILALTEHSQNKISAQSGLFENEIGSGVLQSSVQRTCLLQECQRHKALESDYGSILSLLSRVLTGRCLLKAGLEYSRSNLVFEIRDIFIFGMLCHIGLLNLSVIS